MQFSLPMWPCAFLYFSCSSALPLLKRSYLLAIAVLDFAVLVLHASSITLSGGSSSGPACALVASGDSQAFANSLSLFARKPSCSPPEPSNGLPGSARPCDAPLCPAAASRSCLLPTSARFA